MANKLTPPLAAPVAAPPPPPAAHPAISVSRVAQPETVIPHATGPLNKDGHVAGAILSNEQVADYLNKLNHERGALLASGKTA